MASDASGQPDREEWDLPPAGPLLTRDRLLARARAHGADVSARDLIFWETRGVLPRPPKRWHQGATRAVYPPWAAYYVVALRLLQREGASLGEIAQALRHPFHRTLARVAYPPVDQTGAGTDEVPPWAGALLEELERFASGTGLRAVRAEVGVFDDDGHGKPLVRYALGVSWGAGDDDVRWHYRLVLSPPEGEPADPR